MLEGEGTQYYPGNKVAGDENEHIIVHKASEGTKQQLLAGARTDYYEEVGNKTSQNWMMNRIFTKGEG